MQSDDTILTPDEAARLLKVRPSTLRKWRAKGEGPPWWKQGKVVRYSLHQILDHIQGRSSTAERRSLKPDAGGSSPPAPASQSKPKQHASNGLRSVVVETWPACQAAAAKHGRIWRALSEGRIKKMVGRLQEHGPDPQVLVQAIHGAVAYWAKTTREDMIAYLTPDTVYQEEKFVKYLEAATDPATAPRKKPSEMTPEEFRAFATKGISK